ncbi:hypothetical protein [Pseudomonas sp. GCEP-101]|uniref:hypothetical protein n=1 Tax=Pseudomonas sp. GCEP-101 TaxID=2974552 RepID=UPI00223BAF30|nr:hypothetical protein [Pseudomonas sp. GCEP-101]
MSDDNSETVVEELSESGKQPGLGSRIHTRFKSAGGVSLQDTEEPLEDAAALIIGKMVLMFSCFEMNLGLCLRNLSPQDAPRVDGMRLQDRLDALSKAVAKKFVEKPQSKWKQPFDQWLRRFKSVRIKRNRFIHGRWAVIHSINKVVNVSGPLPGERPGKEVFYSIEELMGELQEIESAIAEFYSWRKKAGV